MPLESDKYLFDILEAIQLIDTFVAGRDFAAYQSDRQLKSAVERQLGIIGEALNQFTRLDASRAGKFMDRRRIVGMRNILIHAYGDVNDTLVWAAIARLPALANEVEGLLGE